MKYIVLALCFGLAAFLACASDYPPALQGSTILTFLPASTNSTSFVASVDNYKYHTFVVQNGGGSNTVTLGFTLDLTNYVPFLTNAFTSAGTVSTQLTGHYQGFRSVTVLNGGATNITNNTEYNGGN